MAARWREPTPRGRAEIPSWLEELARQQQRIRHASLQQRRRAAEMRQLALKVRRDAERFNVQWDVRTAPDR